MDLTLRAVPIQPYTPLWAKILPLAFVALIAYGIIKDQGEPGSCAPGAAPAQVVCEPDRPTFDVSTATRPH